MVLLFKVQDRLPSADSREAPAKHSVDSEVSVGRRQRPLRHVQPQQCSHLRHGLRLRHLLRIIQRQTYPTCHNKLPIDPKCFKAFMICVCTQAVRLVLNHVLL